MRLHRTPSLHDRKWRNEENENWAEIEGKLRDIEQIEDFLEGFDGKRLIEKSYNLFNPETVTVGALSVVSGDVIDGGYYVSDYIPVVPGKRLQVLPTQGVTNMYDDSLNFIQRIPSNQVGYMIPNGVHFVRTQLSQASLDGKYVYQGEAGLPYKDYGYAYSNSLIALIESLMGSDVEEYVNLFNKNNVVIGGLGSTTGELIEGNYRVTEFIKVIPGKRLQVKPTSGWVMVYDANYNFIESIPSATEPKIMPVNAAYIRNQMSEASVNSKYIYLGENDMSYYPYGEGPNTGGSTSQKEIKILCVGNSYSNDTFWMLKDIAESAGYKVTVGISHLSGGTLSQVYDAINSNGTVTTYNKFGSAGHAESSNFNARYIITDEEWDYIFFQQASTSAMDYSTYQPALGNLVSYVKANATNPSVKLGINMPWVRPISHSTIGTAEKQLQVNAAIVDACQQAMYDESLDVFIPTGIAIMNGRSNEYLAQVSDELTRDGSHLDEGIGRYLAALTAFNAIFGEVADGNVTYGPANVNNFHSYLSKISAKKAVIEPFEVTKV